MAAIQLGEQWFDYADVMIDVMYGYACNVQCDYCSITNESASARPMMRA